ncbi:MAG: hypothetical protein EOO15_15195, partial [Chitinophagaceae bacterium]
MKKESSTAVAARHHIFRVGKRFEVSGLGVSGLKDVNDNVQFYDRAVTLRKESAMAVAAHGILFFALQFKLWFARRAAGAIHELSHPADN